MLSVSPLRTPPAAREGHVPIFSERLLVVTDALGADGASQDIIVSNSTFFDLSGGAVKLGKSGERGGNFTRNPPLLVVHGSILTDCL